MMGRIGISRGEKDRIIIYDFILCRWSLAHLYLKLNLNYSKNELLFYNNDDYQKETVNIHFKM